MMLLENVLATESQLSHWLSVLMEQSVNLGWTLLKALLVFVIGRLVIGLINKLVGQILLKRDIDPSVKSFIGSLVHVVLMILLIVSVVGVLGVQTSSFAALLASAGVAVGMALSGNLSNFAGGLIILLFKPFKVGDYIETQGYSGTVNSIQITSTVIKTTDNKTIVLPNGGLSGSIINNYSTSEKRRCDWDISIEYGSDIDLAKSLLLEIVSGNEKVLQEPEKPFVALKSLADSAIIVTCRVWVKREDYWDTFYAVNEEIYKELPKRGIGFPYPQLDVHINNN